MANSLRFYHNKLIKDDGISLTEVANVPCEEMDAWREIARDEHGWRKITDSVPIKGNY